MPFTLCDFDDAKQARMGVVECVKHDLLQEYPVLYERSDAYVAHFKFTVLLLPSGTNVITGIHLPENNMADKVRICFL